MQPNVESENSTQWEPTTDLLQGKTRPRYPSDVRMQHGGIAERSRYLVVCSRGGNEIDICCFPSAFSVLKEIEFTRCLQNYNAKISVLQVFFFFFWGGGRSSLLPSSPEFTSTMRVICEQSQMGRYCWIYKEVLKFQSEVGYLG